MVKNPLRSDWDSYFLAIKDQCPWGYAAWQQGLIDIQTWTGRPQPLSKYQARVYIVNANGATVEKMAEELDEGEHEWLFSYPQYGEFATPVPVLIQQDRATLTKLRKKHGD